MTLGLSNLRVPVSSKKNLSATAATVTRTEPKKIPHVIDWDMTS